jgi:hypothetical protein
MGLIATAGCASNRGSDDSEERIRDTTYQDTTISADTSEGTREMPDSADSARGRTLKVPGDSVRLEDTLSDPPPSDSVR